MEQEISPTQDEIVSNGAPVNDAFYKSIARGGPGMIAIVSYPDMKFMFANDMFEHYIGYTNAQLEALCFTDLLEEYHHDRLLSQFHSVNCSIAARANYCLYRLKNKDGVAMPYFLYASPLKDHTEQGRDCYYLMLQPDLSKWGMPFTSFETKELFLEQFDAEDFGTFEWVVDADKSYWSKGVYRIYEVDDTYAKVDNAIARTFVHPQDKAWVKQASEDAIKNGTDLNIEFRIITAKKNVKLIHALARIIKDGDGKPVKFAGSLRDITNQRAIENDLKNKVEELNHSNKELEEFAYVASHDMQEPLRKITTFSDRLSDKYKDVLTGDGAMYLSRMIIAAENMRNLINDLLEFSRITKSVVPFGPVSLNEVVREVRAELELVIEETGTAIVFPDLPLVDAIGSQMKQLFVNIINNAMKFHKADTTPVITIESTVLTEEEQEKYALEADRKYYKIWITDNGIGFEPEYANRIFQVFQRLHGKSEYPGSGIGLAICKKILEYHKGVIFAENLPDVGARFTFILPEHQKKAKEIKL